MYININNITVVYMAFQYFDYELTWWILSEKRVGHTKFDIYVVIGFIYALSQMKNKLNKELVIQCCAVYTTVS